MIKDADTLDFRGFWRRLRGPDPQGPLATSSSPDDFAGATVTLTNPGTIGTVQSVPRLMPGQGVHRRRRPHRLPGRVPGRRPGDARRPRRVEGHHASRRPTTTASSRAPSRACSSSRSTSCCSASDDFYDDVFRVARRALRGGAVAARRQPGRPRGGDAREADRTSQTLINMHRVRGHLIADLDPLAWKEPHMHSRARPGHLRAHDLGPRPRVPHRRPRPAATGMPLGEILARAARRLLPHDRHRVHAHPGARREALDPGAGRGRRRRDSTPTTSATSSSGSTRPRRSRSSSAPSTSARSASASRAPSRPSRSSTPSSSRPPTPASTARCMGMAHRGRLNVLANIVGKCYDQIFREFEGDVDPESTQGSGDVKYHLGQVGKFVGRAGNEIPVELAANPSPPRDRRPGRRRHGPGQAGPDQRARARSRCCRC